MATPQRPARRRPAGPEFRPRSLYLMAWFIVFFFFYALALVLPSLWPLFSSPLDGPALQEAAARTAAEAIRGHLGIAMGLSFVTTAAGIWLAILPGFRTRA